jgi:excisionase family DNA binding protein
MDQALAEVHPTGRDVDLAREALIRMRPVLDNPGLAGDEPVTITVEGGPEAIVVPKSVLELLVRVLGSLSAGEGITVVPSHAELTTQQAADLLNVSRPHLVKLLSEGQIEFRSVGTHRRVLARSLMEYVKADDQRRREAAAELTRLGQEMSFI